MGIPSPISVTSRPLFWHPHLWIYCSVTSSLNQPNSSKFQVLSRPKTALWVALLLTDWLTHWLTVIVGKHYQRALGETCEPWDMWQCDEETWSDKKNTGKDNDNDKYIKRTPWKSDPRERHLEKTFRERDLPPFRHLINVTRRHDLTAWCSDAVWRCGELAITHLENSLKETCEHWDTWEQQYQRSLSTIFAILAKFYWIQHFKVEMFSVMQDIANILLNLLLWETSDFL